MMRGSSGEDTESKNEDMMIIRAATYESEINREKSKSPELRNFDLQATVLNLPDISRGTS